MSSRAPLFVRGACINRALFLFRVGKCWTDLLCGGAAEVPHRPKVRPGCRCVWGVNTPNTASTLMEEQRCTICEHTKCEEYDRRPGDRPGRERAWIVIEARRRRRDGAEVTG
mmetsp:Transcript_26741/g.53326  ORF Transcript_26741/g.53326 Transcript_26741/m.53326 type:complete len:112 (+) Transcript_26741:46-381(+)